MMQTERNLRWTLAAIVAIAAIVALLVPVLWFWKIAAVFAGAIAFIGIEPGDG